MTIVEREHSFRVATQNFLNNPESFNLRLSSLADRLTVIKPDVIKSDVIKPKTKITQATKKKTTFEDVERYI